jgi:hypothetical protein
VVFEVAQQEEWKQGRRETPEEVEQGHPKMPEEVL